jgi:hypothetical protein
MAAGHDIMVVLSNGLLRFLNILLNKWLPTSDLLFPSFNPGSYVKGPEKGTTWKAHFIKILQ